MFSYLLAFLKEVCPLSIMSMASSSCWFVHLPLPIAIGNLFFFLSQNGAIDLVLLIWLMWQVEIVVGLVFLGYQVGVPSFLDFHNFDLKPHFDIFFGTLRCANEQFVSNPPCICHGMNCWASSPIGVLISTLFLLGPTSKHLRVSYQVLLKVQTKIFCMMTKRLESVSIWIMIKCISFHFLMRNKQFITFNKVFPI